MWLGIESRPWEQEVSALQLSYTLRPVYSTKLPMWLAHFFPFVYFLFLFLYQESNFFLNKSHYIVHAGLELVVILLVQPLDCWIIGLCYHAGLTPGLSLSYIMFVRPASQS